MKKFTKIVLIISGICIIVGIALVIASGLTGAVQEKTRNQTVTAGSAIADSTIQELEISVKAASLEVVEDAKLEEIVISELPSHMEWSYEVDDERLKLAIRPKDRLTNFGDMGMESVVLMIPADQVFQEVSVELDAASFVSDGLYADEMSLELNAASADMTGVQAGVLEIDNNAGALSLSGEVLTELDVECRAGDIDMVLMGSYEDFDYQIGNQAGSMTVGDRDYSGLKESISTDHPDAWKTAKLKCRVGSVELQFED